MSQAPLEEINKTDLGEATPRQLIPIVLTYDPHR